MLVTLIKNAYSYKDELNSMYKETQIWAVPEDSNG